MPIFCTFLLPVKLGILGKFLAYITNGDLNIVQSRKLGLKSQDTRFVH